VCVDEPFRFLFLLLLALIYPRHRTVLGFAGNVVVASAAIALFLSKRSAPRTLVLDFALLFLPCLLFALMLLLRGSRLFQFRMTQSRLANN
jgi:hypothetical protein